MDILLVDDEEIIHRTLGRVLERSGHRVTMALNGMEALRRVEEAVPELIVSDIKMPGMDGLELVQQLCLRAPATPTILITGHGDEDTAIAALQRGAYDYLRKPVRLDRLLDLIDRVAHRKELEQALLAARGQPVRPDEPAALSSLATGIAHEIREPAALIRANLGSMRDVLAAAERELSTALPGSTAGTMLAQHLSDLDQMLQASLQGAGRVCEVVQQMQACVRTGDSSAPQTVDLYECVNRVRSECAASLAAAALTVEGRRVNVAGAPEQLLQAVSSLVTNAAQALDGASGGRIRVTVDSREAGWATVAVTDNGPGVPDQIADRIFEPFFTTRGAGKGLGLGLTLCQRIAESHGGHVGFTSRPGSGCCFSLHLPRTTARAAAAGNTAA